MVPFYPFLGVPTFLLEDLVPETSTNCWPSEFLGKAGYSEKTAPCQSWAPVQHGFTGGELLYLGEEVLHAGIVDAKKNNKEC